MFWGIFHQKKHPKTSAIFVNLTGEKINDTVAAIFLVFGVLCRTEKECTLAWLKKGKITSILAVDCRSITPPTTGHDTIARNEFDSVQKMPR